jgi:hypothetical protein
MHTPSILQAASLLTILAYTSALPTNNTVAEGSQWFIDLYNGHSVNGRCTIRQGSFIGCVGDSKAMGCNSLVGSGYVCAQVELGSTQDWHVCVYNRDNCQGGCMEFSHDGDVIDGTLQSLSVQLNKARCS